jgi:hypothetical protein
VKSEDVYAEWGANRAVVVNDATVMMRIGSNAEERPGDRTVVVKLRIGGIGVKQDAGGNGS